MIKKLILGVLLIFVAIAFASAQPGDPPDPDVPIDGGISLLLAGGALLGAKMLRHINKKKEV